MTSVGVVVIGRNEGNRLKESLLSAIGENRTVVYIDSGSTDGSVQLAQSLGVGVVELDLSIPFTAARARNTGFEHLLQMDPQIDFVQFVDGDCRIVQQWWDVALKKLQQNPEIVVVCGRRKEEFPNSSIYNRLCDIEWDTPIGEAKACGGDAMMRVSAFKSVGGFNPKLIAGEEPELCVRLRQAGGKIFRIDAPMTVHDAKISQFGQWWKRSLRAGHAYAEGSWLHGRSPERHWLKESRSIWFWGLILPVVALLAAWFTFGVSLLLLLLAYTLLTYRIYQSGHKRGLTASDARLYAIWCMLSKFPQLQGQLQFHFSRILRRQQQLVEYKNTSVVS
ncbi:glycosyltransferase family 2 protein [Mastigocoleus testarum]|uniref:4,4'-diaponeurosporenoate glycosyltransferase n=1 Tax=Mastigocoleus testarum BC008 TaxID=371196 RepID=A0A0V8A0G3_9CYAN|nr:glycosyltransferase [Mastigocoleus testarum]KST62303.1 glycosyl transferase [Mastigocoleus testarum BC008]KST70272.1 glycosyl transferase [Mastigocoleus testarum BC008]